jgi:N-acetylglucosaminyldiphosphoundecaprenol N-acetyl-beta-D-mannosaminyltransferase
MDEKPMATRNTRAVPCKPVQEDLPRVRIFGGPIDAVTRERAAAAFVDAATRQRGIWLNTTHLESLRLYRRDPTARRLIDAADVVVADGAPIVWAAKLAGTPLPERVAGSDLIYDIARQAAKCGVSLFLVGGAPGTADAAARRLADVAPSLSVVGTLCPPMGFDIDRDAVDAIVEQVSVSGAGIVLVALGFPKQDLLIERLRQRRPEASYVGLGISFSFVAGEVRRAPRWLQRFGLEWVHRLVQEPRRLATRYLIHGMPFAGRMMASAAAHRASRGRLAPGLWGAGRR